MLTKFARPLRRRTRELVIRNQGRPVSAWCLSPCFSGHGGSCHPVLVTVDEVVPSVLVAVQCVASMEPQVALGLCSLFRHPAIAHAVCPWMLVADDQLADVPHRDLLVPFPGLRAGRRTSRWPAVPGHDRAQRGPLATSSGRLGCFQMKSIVTPIRFVTVTLFSCSWSTQRLALKRDRVTTRPPAISEDRRP
jgi:hypothetical protein